LREREEVVRRQRKEKEESVSSRSCVTRPGDSRNRSATMSEPPKPDAKPAVHNPDGRPLGPDGKPLPGPAQMQQIMAQKRMAQQQAQVDEVVGIMRNNVEKVLERDQKLNELDERADALQDGASQFEKQAGKLKNKFWMENMKWIIIGVVVGLILIGLIYWKYFATPEPRPYPPYGGPGYAPQQPIQQTVEEPSEGGGESEGKEES